MTGIVRWPRLRPSGKGAHLRKALEGLKLARHYPMTVSPIIVAGGQNDWMPDALKRVVDRLETLVGTWQRTSRWVSSVGSADILEVANMDNKGKVRCVHGREQALKALDALRGVTCIANQAELESAVLRMDGGETDQRQRKSERNDMRDTEPLIIAEMRIDRARHGCLPGAFH
jgi:hypothetical protein